MEKTDQMKFIRLTTAPTFYSIGIITTTIVGHLIAAFAISYAVLKLTPVERYIDPVIINLIFVTLIALRPSLNKLGVYTEAVYSLYTVFVVEDKATEKERLLYKKALPLRGNALMEKLILWRGK